ncbi:hypothetical protein HZA85_04270 [Candidatus Uhrbacteria bacterium]|nr:hypothetical protein [Candidatus Uhrbacteria bacterium]
MHRSLSIIVVGVLVVLSLTGASYLVLTKFSPQREIRLMLVAMSAQGAFSQNSGWSWTHTVNQKQITTTLYTSGQIDWSDPARINHRSAFHLVRVGDENAYANLSGEWRRVNGVDYLTYHPPGPVVPGVDFSQDGTWVSFEQKELASWGPILLGVDVPLDLTLTKTVWTPEGLERLHELLSVADVFLVSYNGLTELIDGAQTRILDARFDSDALHAFTNALVRAKEGDEPTDAQRIRATMLADQLRQLSLRFWIGTKDHRLYRLQTAGPISQDNGQDPVQADIRIDFHFPKPAELIEPPSRALTFATLLHATLTPSANGSRTLGSQQTFVNDATVRLPIQQIIDTEDIDNDGLPSLLEAFYGTDPTRADSDGDGVNDGDEVSQGRNPSGKGSLFGFGL